MIRPITRLFTALQMENIGSMFLNTSTRGRHDVMRPYFYTMLETPLPRERPASALKTKDSKYAIGKTKSKARDY